MLGDVGKRFLRDSIKREAFRRRHSIGRPVDPQLHRQARSCEIVHQLADVVDVGFRNGARRRFAEQSDRSPDVGHRLPAELFGMFEGVHRLVDVTILLQRTSRTGDMQQRDGQGMSDDVVDFTGDAPALVGGGVLGQPVLRQPLLDQ